MDETLDIPLLRTVVAIDDFGGFSRAAEALHRSQPTVSQHVRVLEHRLGRALVEKHGRGARFTADGRRLLAEARHLIAAHDAALRRLRGHATGASDVGGADAGGEQEQEQDAREREPQDAALRDETAHAADFLHYVATRMPQLIGEWTAGRPG
ncbi:LysR family transcriptional regulator [Microbacterium sp. SD291]|uniref:LysR family transcriptional regulator n=1 Tax=Microbacterium sp. SD291 TaxID=2782007 RepID=UPI001A9586E5|nr:LysR family transcriptional regulator [Microbacterium sp. SD291]MBO0979617.1 LysR family transcriptional regulator [Microbacterium sp. SD291]